MTMTGNNDDSIISYEFSKDRQRIENARFNMDQLAKVNSLNYPKLAKILDARRQAKRNRIMVILEYLAQEEETSFTLDSDGSDKRAFTDTPYAELEARGGGRGTYAAIINLMCLTGLMVKHDPNTIDKDHTTWLDGEARQHAGRQRNRRKIQRKKDFKARIYYHLPKWTPEVLAHAEEVAAANTGTLTRAIDTYGTDQAQQGLDTHRKIPQDTQRAREQIRAYVEKHIAKGYVTRAEIMRGVHPLTTRELKRRQRIKDGKQASPATGRKTVDLKRIIPAYMRKLAEDLELNYARPTAEQIERYQLKDKSFILTPKQSNYTLEESV